MPNREVDLVEVAVVSGIGSGEGVGGEVVAGPGVHVSVD